MILAAEFHVVGLPADRLDSVPHLVAVVGGRRLESRADRGWSISAQELSIRGAHIPLRYISGVVALDARTLRRLIGREGDPQAFVSIRPWIGPGVQLQLDDPDDPTPYWVISTRHPDRVVALLRAATSADCAH